MTAVIKATDVMLAKGAAGQMSVSARNRLSGRIESVHKGEAIGLVTVAAGQARLGAVVTRQAIEELGLTQGDQVHRSGEGHRSDADEMIGLALSVSVEATRRVGAPQCDGALLRTRSSDRHEW